MQRATAVTLTLCGLAASGQPVFFDAGTTATGTPYAFIGVDRPVWEVYRKREVSGTLVPAAISLTALDAGVVRFDRLVAGCTGTDCAFTGVTMFAPGPMDHSPQGAVLELLGASSMAQPVGIDIRVGFLELDASDGGRGPTTFVNAAGGDLGMRMDPNAGNWGINGLMMHLTFECGGPTWLYSLQQATLISGQSSLLEVNRTNYAAQVAMTSQPLTRSTTQPLRVEWRLGVANGATVFYLQVQDQLLAWVVDDGAAVTGLTDAGNPDGVPYVGGKLSSLRMVPTVFLGPANFSSGPLPLAEMQLDLNLVGKRLVLGAPAIASVGEAMDASVLLLDEAGGTVGSTASAVITSSDALAIPNVALHATMNRFSFQWATPGLQTLMATVSDDSSLTDSIVVLVTADAGTPDAGTSDAGTADAGTPDAGTPDAGSRDAGSPDAGALDAGAVDGGAAGTRYGVGCSCAAASSGSWVGVLAAFSILIRRAGGRRRER